MHTELAHFEWFEWVSNLCFSDGFNLTVIQTKLNVTVILLFGKLVNEILVLIWKIESIVIILQLFFFSSLQVRVIMHNGT